MTPEIGLLRRPSWALAPAKAAHRLSSSERTMLRECARRYVRTATGVHDLRMAAHLRGVRIHAGNAIAMLINPSTGGSAKLIAAVKNAASHWDCNEAHAAGDFEAASNNGCRRLPQMRGMAVTAPRTSSTASPPAAERHPDRAKLPRPHKLLAEHRRCGRWGALTLRSEIRRLLAHRRRRLDRARSAGELGSPHIRACDWSPTPLLSGGGADRARNISPGPSLWPAGPSIPIIIQI